MMTEVYIGTTSGAAPKGPREKRLILYSRMEDFDFPSFPFHLSSNYLAALLLKQNTVTQQEWGMRVMREGLKAAPESFVRGDPLPI